MSDKKTLFSREDQFRLKQAARRAAAAAPFEEKIARLIQLQEISCELARRAGRPEKKPWKIS